MPVDKKFKTTESASNYDNLEEMNTKDILTNINNEDKLVPLVIEKVISKIKKLVDAAFLKLSSGGRLFYIGSGTSGRLGIVDASECPPTFGVPHDLVIGLIAGGDAAIRKAVEFAEDNATQGWIDLKKFKITSKDFLIGIAASGTTPYVIGALKEASKNKILTGCITCNKNSELAKVADFPIEVIVGPEFLTGSTRMKAGTAQKLVLNMISTSLMIKLGRVEGNKMVDMMLTNDKLVHRGTEMVKNKLGITTVQAKKLLLKEGSVREAIKSFNSSK